MNQMFCFQCEQTACSKACTGQMGVCHKGEDTARLQDALTSALIALGRASEGTKPTESTHKVVIEGLFATLTNVNFDNQAIQALIDQAAREKEKLVPQCDTCKEPCGRNDGYPMENLWTADPDIRSVKSLILFGLRGIAAYAYHGLALGYSDDTVNQFFYKGLYAVGSEWTFEELLTIALETGKVNYRCMKLLNQANTDAYGIPAPTQVSMTIEKGPFIVVSGHDLKDLYGLLEQTKDKGIQIYTHGEMLPAHAYPKLKAYPHLKGNFGTAWQNQQKEFDQIPGPVLFTTNCLMPPKDSYRDRVFTTGVVAYPGLKQIGEDKDFAPVIEKALELGGYREDTLIPGINGGTCMTTGFSHQAVLAAAPQIIDAVKNGKIKHFFLVGGCDGPRKSRSYYTEFVKMAPKDSVILTLACGKYRFNDLDLGDIDGIPRLLDLGQCNDAYSAIQIALALAEAFHCGVNELPLTLVISWFEQKAVSILLTLLSLGIKNIYLGPTLPAFLSPNVLDYLVNEYEVHGITTPEEDLKNMLA